MILIVCKDDAPNLLQIATDSLVIAPQVFGRIFETYKEGLPALGEQENLFIIAHGAFKGDDGNPVIGDKSNDLYFNAVELYLNIEVIFPQDYAGNVYVDACYSADDDGYTLSFIDVLQGQIQASYGNTVVFGRNGESFGLIPLPGAQGWKKAGS